MGLSNLTRERLWACTRFGTRLYKSYCAKVGAVYGGNIGACFAVGFVGDVFSPLRCLELKKFEEWVIR